MAKAPCVAGECKAEARADGKEEGKPETKVEGKAENRTGNQDGDQVEIVAGSSAAGKVSQRSTWRAGPASYCVYELSRVDVRPDPRRNGCPRSWLRNFLAIKLIDGDGPFARATWTSSTCTARMPAPAAWTTARRRPILDGVFRRRMWTVPLADGAAAFIARRTSRAIAARPSHGIRCMQPRSSAQGRSKDRRADQAKPVIRHRPKRSPSRAMTPQRFHRNEIRSKTEAATST